MALDLILLTEEQYINPEGENWYTSQILHEQKLILDRLQKRGISTKKVSWDDPHFDWESAQTVLIREIWDYFIRFDEFSKWLNSVEGKTKFINPIQTVKWNIDKHYLADLEIKGVPIVPSYFIERGSKTSLEEILRKTGWTETVIKPTVSGAARHTYKLQPDNYTEHDDIIAELLKTEDMMLQPFMKHIQTKGEVSHIVIGGKYSHSILKKAKSGDYRVQDDWGGSVHPYNANEEEIIYAEKVANACSPLPFYARVDVVWDNEDNLALGELELIEPELWFREKPEAATLLADEIVRRCFQ